MRWSRPKWPNSRIRTRQMHGNWKAGRRIVMSYAWAAEHDFQSNSAPSSGPFVLASEPVWQPACQDDEDGYVLRPRSECN
jgi:hypothetical protein